MFSYISDIENFKKATVSDIVTTMRRNLSESKSILVSESEIGSWEHTIVRFKEIAQKLKNDFLVSFEYCLIGSLKRIDVLLLGKDEDNNLKIFIVEAKRWSNAVAAQGDGLVKTVIGNSLRELVHPSYQAWSYKNFLQNYNSELEETNSTIVSLVWLQNFNSELNGFLNSKRYEKYVELAAIVDDEQLIKNLSTLNGVPTNDQLDLFESVKFEPSKAMQQTLKNIFNKKSNSEFLVDDQLVVYKNLQNINPLKNKKTVVIVKGGPGTGKSLIALNLLNYYIQQGHYALYVTRSSTLRVSFKNLLTKDDIISKSYLDSLFANPSKFIELDKNSIDFSIVDEAHRLTTKSGLYANKGANQIDEIIKASKSSIFFVDEDQMVSATDIGSYDEIVQKAKQNNATILNFELNKNFRNSGSGNFVLRIRSILYDDVLDKSKYEDDSLFVKVFDDPNVMFEQIVKLNTKGNNARIVAGYCWDWNKKTANDPHYHDIVIDEHNFRKSLNLAVNTFDWAVDKNTVNQVGGHHAIQGLELEHVGIIIGPDLKLVNGQIVTDRHKRAHTDRSFLKIKHHKDPNKAIRKIILNTYFVLLTRATKTCYIFAVDKALNDALKSIFN